MGADAQLGHNGGGQDQHPHATQPVGEGPPEQDALGQGLDVGEDGGAGGGKAGAGFKDGVHGGGEPAGEQEGQGAHQAGENPDQPYRHKALPGEKLLPCRQGGQGEAHGGHNGNGKQEGQEILPVEQGHRQGQDQGGRLQQQHPPHQL